ncbi:MAG: hypothetical protein PHS74_07055 [Lachnospiraceae bacterium]|nr:hypothetical protein [Lachnospiraceae bacterium]
MKKGAIAVLSSLIGATAGTVTTGIIRGKTIQQKEKKVDKFKTYYNILNQWLILKQEGKTLEKFFKDNNYKTIAIYGMGEMGNRLYEDLRNTDIEVKYAIDKDAGSCYTELVVKDLEDELEEVDAVVVTAVFAIDEIKKEIKEQLNVPTISLEDVVYEA